MNTQLRKGLTEIGVREAQRFSSRCFRRGAAQALQEQGSPLGEILRAGGWSSGAYRAYLSLNKSEGASMERVLANEPQKLGQKDGDVKGPISRAAESSQESSEADTSTSSTSG